MVVLGYTPETLKVIIPVGGRAKRLMPLTAEASKACVRLANRPIIEIAIQTLAKQGVKYFVFGVKGYQNYKSLFDYFQEGIGYSAKYGIRPRIHIKYQPNEDDCGSADSARITMEYYDLVDPFFGVQGDNIFDIDLKSLLRFHREKGGIATICLKKVENVEGYGVAEIDEDMRIHRFAEKPRKEEAPSNLANTGLYLFSPEIREVMKYAEIKKMIHENKRLDFGYDLIPYLIRSGQKVYGYEIEKGWYDLGTPERYLDALYDILRGRVECICAFQGQVSPDRRLWIQGESPESIIRRERIVRMIENGKIDVEEPVLIGRHCQIEEGARVSNSCIDNFTKIGKGTVIEDSAIMDRVNIGDHAEIRKSIIGRHAVIESLSTKPTRILAVSVVGDNVRISAGCRLKGGKIWPHLELTEGSYEGEIRSTKT